MGVYIHRYIYTIETVSMVLLGCLFTYQKTCYYTPIHKYVCLVTRNWEGKVIYFIIELYVVSTFEGFLLYFESFLLFSLEMFEPYPILKNPFSVSYVDYFLFTRWIWSSIFLSFVSGKPSFYDYSLTLSFVWPSFISVIYIDHILNKDLILLVNFLVII